MNQNPEQIARDRIDNMLKECGWIIQSKKKINIYAGCRSCRLYTFHR